MTTLSQRSFSGGEISPSLYSRVDTVKYATGLRTCRNFFVLRHGGAANRPGTQFIGEVKNSNNSVRLVPFVFNADQTYVLEFGDLYIRIIRNGAYVLETATTITGISKAATAVVTSASHGYSNGDEVYISGVVGMTEVNGRNFVVGNVAANTYELFYLSGAPVDSLLFGTYTSGGTAEEVYTVASPYVEADLPDLRYVQSADVVTIVHKSYAPRELTRTGHASWTLSSISFVPDIGTPAGLTNNGAVGSTYKWKVTAVAAETYEESLPSSQTTSSTTPAVGTPVTLDWTDVTGAVEYNVYRDDTGNGIFGFVGTASASTFIDIGVAPDYTDAPPVSRTVFASSGNYPGTVAYAQQRLMFGASTNDPEKVWGSRIGIFHNFTVSSPIQDDDSLIFTMAGRQVNEIKHLVDLGKLVILTTSGEWLVGGNAAGIITPTEINPKQQAYNGSSDLTPIVAGSNSLYVQARGSICRDLIFDYQVDGYRGNDLTIFSSHLFDNFELLDWTYQQIPHSIAWVVRDEGTLLGLTYIREQQIFAWHRHDFDGTVENVCAVPEGLEDSLYMVVNRTIDGRQVRYVERMYTRSIDDIVDSVFLDSALTYDGRNTDDSITMTLSGGTDWDYEETLTLTASFASFVSTDVGNQVHLTGSDGSIIRFTIAGFTSTTVVTGTPNVTVPSVLQDTATSTWSMAVDELSNLWHLEGEDVGVFADGFVIASPNNESYAVITVEDGAVTLPRHFGVIHVGLPITSDIETLDIDTVNAETMADKKKSIGKVTLHVEDSRGVFAGPKPPEGDDPLDGLYECKVRDEEGYDDPVSLKTGTVDVVIGPEWNSNGRVFVRQVDPVPTSILAISPAGLLPFVGGRRGA